MKGAAVKVAPTSFSLSEGAEAAGAGSAADPVLTPQLPAWPAVASSASSSALRGERRCRSLTVQPRSAECSLVCSVDGRQPRTTPNLYADRDLAAAMNTRGSSPSATAPLAWQPSSVSKTGDAFPSLPVASKFLSITPQPSLTPQIESVVADIITASNASEVQARHTEGVRTESFDFVQPTRSIVSKCSTNRTSSRGSGRLSHQVRSTFSRSFSERFEGVSTVDVTAVFCACSLPTVVVLLGFSLPFYGFEVFLFVTPREVMWYYQPILAFSLVWLFLLFVLDAHKASSVVKSALGATTYAMAVMVALFRGVLNPWAIVMQILCAAPALLLQIRIYRWHVRRLEYYNAIGCCNLAISAVVFGGWIFWLLSCNNAEVGAPWSDRMKQQLIKDTEMIYRNVYAPGPLSYETDCGPHKVLAEDDDVQLAIESACKRVETIQLVVWATPILVVAFNVVVALFCLLQARLDLDKDRDVVRLVRQFLSTMTFLAMGMYSSAAYLFGTSSQLAQAMVFILGVAVIGLVIFIYCEVKPKVIRELSATSAVAKYTSKASKSNIAKAVAVYIWGSIVPVILLCDLVRQCMRKARGKQTNTGRFTELGEKIVAEMSTWDWHSVLSLVCSLGVLCVVLVLGSKFTFILFSWLNARLCSYPLEPVMLIVFVVGILMFMLPPVPGSAVYVFVGIVVGKHAQQSMNFWLGILVASVLALLAKLAGCTGQYMIGYALGKDVRVQKLIGVDTVPTRALEKILKSKGWTIGKVAILVGGPDWPTSVTCGILKMNIPQMLLGTLPVYVVSVIPQTVVGALLTRDMEQDPEYLRSLSTTCTGAAALAQAIASLIAMHKITKTLEMDSEELRRPRPEHAQVAELTRRKARHTEVMKTVSEWSGPYMTLRRKATILCAAIVILVCGAILGMDFVFSEPLCFRKFAIVDDIGASFQDGGLQGNALNVIIFPLGVVDLVLCAIAVALFRVHAWELRRTARVLLPPDTE